MRLLTVLCVAALVVAFAVPASAETQNIKVSGDIKAAYVYQHNINFADNAGDSQNFFMQQMGLNVEADLTDNVSTYIRLINERDWGYDLDADAAAKADSTQFEVLLDEAYVTLKEMLYAPLTVKIGRQNIWLGKGLVIGNSGTWRAGQLTRTVQEYSDMTAFDAVRATLDYDPWTIDLIYSKINGSDNAFTNDDVDLYIANVGYDFTKYDAEAEAYYIYSHDKTDSSAHDKEKPDTIHTIGLRGSLVPFESMNLWAEGAFQLGKDRSTASTDQDRKAGAVNVGLDYTFTDVKWTPTVGAEWIWLSGSKVGQSKEHGWNPLYRGKYDNYIADFRGLTKGVTGDSGLTNQQSIALFGSIAPMTDITMDAKWTYLLLDNKLADSATRDGGSDKVGWELDAKVAYDYTEDVQLSVCGGYLNPGSSYKSGSDKGATQVVAGVAVDF
jgi:predicted porin